MSAEQPHCPSCPEYPPRMQYLHQFSLRPPLNAHRFFHAHISWTIHSTKPFVHWVNEKVHPQWDNGLVGDPTSGIPVDIGHCQSATNRYGTMPPAATLWGARFMRLQRCGTRRTGLREHRQSRGSSITPNTPTETADPLSGRNRYPPHGLDQELVVTTAARSKKVRAGGSGSY